MIEQLGRMLARVFLLKEDGNLEKAIGEIDSTCTSSFGIDPVLLDSLPVDNLADMLGVGRDPSGGSIKCILVGRLLKEKAAILSLYNRSHAIDGYHKALSLYLNGFLNIGYMEIDLTPYANDIKVIAGELDGLLTNAEMHSLSKFYNMTEDNATVENMLKPLESPDPQ